MSVGDKDQLVGFQNLFPPLGFPFCFRADVLTGHVFNDLHAGHVTVIHLVECPGSFFQHGAYTIPFGLQVVFPEPADMPGNELLEGGRIDHIFMSAGFYLYICGFITET